MMSELGLDDKVRIFIDSCVDELGDAMSGDICEWLEINLRRLLKEQDRDTRHAIAEALNSTPSLSMSIDGFSDDGVEMILQSTAHNIAMNCRGGLYHD